MSKFSLLCVLLLSSFLSGVNGKIVAGLLPHGHLGATACATSCGLSVCNSCVCKQRNGSLSNTFGVGGKVITDFKQSDDRSTGVVVLPNGMIIAVGGSDACGEGNSYDFALTRYTSYGALDTCFGVNGKVLTDFSHKHSIKRSCDYAFACALYQCRQCNCVAHSQVPCGRGCGEKCNGSCGMHDDKKCDTHCKDQCTLCCDSCDDKDRGKWDICCTMKCEVCRDVSTDPHCKVVVVGSTTATISGKSAFAVARYTSDGCLDTCFNGTGKVITPMCGDAYAQAVAVQPDGKIVVAGYVKKRHGGSDFVVVRYLCNGCLDKSFGCTGTGIVTTHFACDILKPSEDVAYALKIQLNGKIIVAGSSTGRDGKRHFALARYKSNGLLDTSFGTKDSGKVITCCGGTDEVIRALVLQEPCTLGGDVRIIAIGYSHGSLSGKANFTLVGYKNNGHVDKEFGPCGKGIVITRFRGDAGAYAYAGIAQQGGEIVVAGTRACKEDHCFVTHFALASYTSHGYLERSFGVNGKVITAFAPDSDDQAYALAQQENGSIIAAGFSNASGTNDFALARYNICKHPKKEFVCC